MRYLVLTFLCLVAVIAYVQRLGVQTADKPIQAEFAIDTEQFGALGTAWLLGYAIFQIPAGWLADRIGSRNALGLLAIVWSLIAGSIGTCERYETFLIMWFGMGVALAGIFPCAAKSIGAWFPRTERATASGLLGSCTMLGTAAASFVTSRLLGDAGWSWRAIYVLYGGVGIGWAVAYFVLVPERSGGDVASEHAPAVERGSFRKIVASVPMWLLCGQQFFRAGAMIFFINWFPKFLKEWRGGLGETRAGDYAAIVNSCALAGGLLGGFASDWLLRRTGRRRLSRQGIAVVGLGSAAGLVSLALMTDQSTAIQLFAAAAFVASFGGVSGYTVAIEFGGRRVGLVFSIMNMCGNLGAALANQAISSLKERTGSWDSALVAVAGILIVDAICWALLNPKEPLFGEETP